MLQVFDFDGTLIGYVEDYDELPVASQLKPEIVNRMGPNVRILTGRFDRQEMRARLAEILQIAPSNIIMNPFDPSTLSTSEFYQTYYAWKVEQVRTLLESGQEMEIFEDMASMLKHFYAAFSDEVQRGKLHLYHVQDVTVRSYSSICEE